MFVDGNWPKLNHIIVFFAEYYNEKDILGSILMVISFLTLNTREIGFCVDLFVCSISSSGSSSAFKGSYRSSLLIWELLEVVVVEVFTESGAGKGGGGVWSIFEKSSCGGGSGGNGNDEGKNGGGTKFVELLVIAGGKKDDGALNEGEGGGGGGSGNGGNWAEIFMTNESN